MCPDYERKDGSVDGLSGLREDVAGVDYDDNSYYVVFYVCNREATADVNNNEYGQGTQKGDTIGQEGNLNRVNADKTQTAQASVDGVYVHTITSWTNQYKNEAAGKDATDYVHCYESYPGEGWRRFCQAYRPRCRRQGLNMLTPG